MYKKFCIVPMCHNSNVKTPDKLFFSVPGNADVRKKWMKAMRRADPLTATSHVHCCEDHFDIETDMENYLKYRLVGGKLFLKKGAVPHKFLCQEQQSEKTECIAIGLINEVLNKDLPYNSHNIEEIYIEHFDKVHEHADDGDEHSDKFKDADPLENNDKNTTVDNSEKTQKKYSNKEVQVCIKNKMQDNNTMTEEKYFKSQTVS